MTRLTASEVAACTATTGIADPLRGLRYSPDADDFDTIAEFWSITNDPSSGFEPAERVELIQLARLLSSAIAERMHDDLACAVETAAYQRQWLAERKAS